MDLEKMRWINKINEFLTWDENRDATATPKKPLPWVDLRPEDRLVLEVVADGVWCHETILRQRLGWGRLRFMVATVRLVVKGWLESRKPPMGMFFESEYRLAPWIWER